MINRNKALEAMKAKGLKQKDLANAAGVTSCMMSKYMHGTYDMKISPAVRVANLLGMRVEELFNYE